MRLSARKLDAHEALRVRVDVTNRGSRPGKETVMLFLSQAFRSRASPEVKMLKRFEKIYLKVGETKTIEFVLTQEDWGVYEPQIGHGFHRIIEPGAYYVAIKHDTECVMYEPKRQHRLCKRFDLTDDTHHGEQTEALI